MVIRENTDLAFPRKLQAPSKLQVSKGFDNYVCVYTLTVHCTVHSGLSLYLPSVAIGGSIPEAVHSAGTGEGGGASICRNPPPHEEKARQGLSLGPEKSPQTVALGCLHKGPSVLEQAFVIE